MKTPLRTLTSRRPIQYQRRTVTASNVNKLTFNCIYGSCVSTKCSAPSSRNCVVDFCVRRSALHPRVVVDHSFTVFISSCARTSTTIYLFALGGCSKWATLNVVVRGATHIRRIPSATVMNSMDIFCLTLHSTPASRVPGRPNGRCWSHLFRADRINGLASIITLRHVRDQNIPIKIPRAKRGVAQRHRNNKSLP